MSSSSLNFFKSKYFSKISQLYSHPYSEYLLLIFIVTSSFNINSPKYLLGPTVFQAQLKVLGKQRWIWEVSGLTNIVDEYNEVEWLLRSIQTLVENTQFSCRKENKCGIRLLMEGNSSTELDRRLLTLSGAAFLCAEVNCVSYSNLWVTSSSLSKLIQVLALSKKMPAF